MHDIIPPWFTQIIGLVRNFNITQILVQIKRKNQIL